MNPSDWKNVPVTVTGTDEAKKRAGEALGLALVKFLVASMEQLPANIVPQAREAVCKS